MVDMPCRGRLNLFPSTNVDILLEKFTQLIIMLMYYFMIST